MSPYPRQWWSPPAWKLPLLVVGWNLPGENGSDIHSSTIHGTIGNSIGPWPLQKHATSTAWLQPTEPLPIMPQQTGNRHPLWQNHLTPSQHCHSKEYTVEKLFLANKKLAMTLANANFTIAQLCLPNPSLAPPTGSAWSSDCWPSQWSAIKPDWDPTGYYCIHGFKVKMGHISATCSHQKESHNNTTRSNTKGGAKKPTKVGCQVLEGSHHQIHWM